MTGTSSSSDPVVVLDQATCRKRGSTLLPISLTLGRGIFALVGHRDEGPALLLRMLAGFVRARSGRVTLWGHEPTHSLVRPRVAYVPLDVVLPDALRVDEVFELAASIRGEAKREARARLALLDVESLANRRVSTLSLEEARAVALAEALSSQAGLVLLEEPTNCLEPPAAARLADAIRSVESQGRTVLFATASVRDATELATELHLFRRGQWMRRIDGHDALAAETGDARLSVIAKDVRPLVALLGQDPAVLGVEMSGRAIVVRGSGVTALAAAVGRAISQAQVDVQLVRVDAPVPEQLLGTRPPPSLAPPARARLSP